MRRGLWFAAGAASGVYALTRARRTVEAFTPHGMRDRLAGLSLGARLFSEEVKAEMTQRENELRARPTLELSGGPPRSIAAQPSPNSTKRVRSS